MKKYIKLISASILLCILAMNTAIATPEKGAKCFYIIKLHSEIDNSSSRLMQDALAQAKSEKADYCIIDINTYGGALDAADSIRTAIMHFPIPVIAFINNQAASAGALISIACDSIYMRQGSSIGAATVVDQSGNVLPNKYQSFMRAMMRATAESSGRDPMIAQAMVSKDSVLSFTPTEAMENNYCEGLAESVEDVVQMVIGSENGDYIIKEHKISLLDKIIYLFLSPFVQGLLLMLIIGGIYFELQSPGVGFPLIAALTGIVLYFVPLYLEGFVQNWEIILFIVGVILLFVEVFLLPGFGVAGVSGLVLVIVTLAFAMIDNDILLNGGEYNLKPLVKPFAIVLVSTTSMLFLSVYLASRLYPTKGFSRIALKTDLSSAQGGFVGVETSSLDEYIGKKGVVTTDLKPQGSVEIDGKRFQAQLNFGFAAKGEIVEILRHEGGRLYCKKDMN